MGEDLIQFQKENCKSCRYADQKEVGTGRPCCTFLGTPEIKDGLCFSGRREEEKRRKPDAER